MFLLICYLSDIPNAKTSSAAYNSNGIIEYSIKYIFLDVFEINAHKNPIIPDIINDCIKNSCISKSFIISYGMIKVNVKDNRLIVVQIILIHFNFI